MSKSQLAMFFGRYYFSVFSYTNLLGFLGYDARTDHTPITTILSTFNRYLIKNRLSHWTWHHFEHFILTPSAFSTIQRVWMNRKQHGHLPTMYLFSCLVVNMLPVTDTANLSHCRLMICYDFIANKAVGEIIHDCTNTKQTATAFPPSFRVQQFQKQ